MEECEEPIYQYYTVINENDSENEEKIENEIVFFNLDNDQLKLSGDERIPDLSTEENEIQEADNISSFGSNVKIITLEDGRMFMTTSDDENFESIEPHLISDDPNNLEVKVEKDVFSDDQNSNDDTNYNLVELVGRSNSTFQMVYCDVDSDPKIKKKKKSFACVYKGCGKSYSVANHLNVHMRNHLDSKPYVCTEESCDKTFSTNYSLKAHIRTHTGEKPYACIVCQKCFKTSGDLQKHFRIHTGEKPFVCPIEGCGKSFTTSNIRKVHIRSHTGERPYTCDYPNCGKAFSSSTNYKNHIRIHSGEKPYVCNVEGCGRRFTEYSSLYKHNLVHQTDRPYTCLFCGQKFKHESTMKVHKSVKHNVIVSNDGTEIVVDLN